MAVAKPILDFTDLVLTKDVKLVLTTISTTKNWKKIYSQLFEGGIPENIQNQIKNLPKKQHSSSQWSALVSSFNGESTQQRDPSKDTSGRFEHFNSFINRIQSVEGQDAFPDPSVAIKVYMTACQPNYESLESLPMDNNFVLMHMCKEEIKRFRKDPDLQEKYEKQLPDLLRILLAQSSNRK